MQELSEDTLAALREAQAGKEDARSCTCHPDERPEPCERKHASRDCWRSAVLKETQAHIVRLKNQDRSPEEQQTLNYLMRVREALEQ